MVASIIVATAQDDAASGSAGEIQTWVHFARGDCRQMSSVKVLSAFVVVLFVAGGLSLLRFFGGETGHGHEHIDYIVPTAFFQCKRIYIDMGANIGVHSRFLFEPEKYPPKEARFHLKEMYELFDKHFGKPPERKQPNMKSKICVFGFEASPTKSKRDRMTRLNMIYNVKGLAVDYKAGMAVWHSKTEIEFFMEGDTKANEFGTGNSMYTWEAQGGFNRQQKVSVPTVDMVSFVKGLYKKYEPEFILGKMDIEGAEFDVLPKMLEGGVLCSGSGFDIITIEYHKRMFRDDDKRSQWKLPETYKCSSGKKTQFLELDVEEYHNDPVPLE